jgi:starch phosphorylase
MSLIETKAIISKYLSVQPNQNLVAYLSMEFAIDQCLKIYSGGLGFLAGSHFRSAYELNQNIIGVGILWKYGYYDQTRDADNSMQVSFIRKEYSFLVDTEIKFQILVNEHPVWVKAWLLPPDTFSTAPLFLLSTDLPENDYLSQTIADRLYAPNDLSRIAGSILLGSGAHKLMKMLELDPNVWHLNEAHGLPLIYSLYQEYNHWDIVKQKTVFTTHTPELAGNERRPMEQLWKMSFFCGVSWDEVYRTSYIENGIFSYTETAIKCTRKQNAVSKLHEKVCKENLYSHLEGEMNMESITNAQNTNYWQDLLLNEFLQSNNDLGLVTRKKELKSQLFKIVADQTGKIFDPNILTIVWARRFAGYKRAWFLIKDLQRFNELTNRINEPIQVIWAGRPYPSAQGDIDLFHRLERETRYNKRAAVLTGYELELSGCLKKGSDIWLNTPRYLHEASGTSGMTAAMNATLNLSIDDGWVAEFAKHGQNAFVIAHANENLSDDQRDEQEYQLMMQILEKEIIPMYYNNSSEWVGMIKQSMEDVTANFNSNRMALEYYQKLYS